MKLRVTAESVQSVCNHPSCAAGLCACFLLSTNARRITTEAVAVSLSLGARGKKKPIYLPAPILSLGASCGTV